SSTAMSLCTALRRVQAAAPNVVAWQHLQHRGLADAVPVGKVVRGFAVKVNGEAGALKLDAITRKFVRDARANNVPGFIGAHRMLCKSEWDYRWVLERAPARPT